MQLGISIMLAFSVFKLRLSDDVPVQSDSIPLINIYFTGCMSFSLSAMIWFSIMNILKENKVVPKWLRILTEKWVCYILCTKAVAIQKHSCSFSKKVLALEKLLAKGADNKYTNEEEVDDKGGFEPDKMLQAKPAYLLKINNSPGDEIFVTNYSPVRVLSEKSPSKFHVSTLNRTLYLPWDNLFAYLCDSRHCDHGNLSY